MRVDELIAAYRHAIAEEDQAEAVRLLALLEAPEYVNQSDWETIKTFCMAERFDARLELITKSLIRKNAARTAEPFLVLARLLVKSGRVAQAKPLIAEFRRVNGDSGHAEWDLTNLLYEIEAYEECLHVIEQALRRNPGQFHFLIMEAQALGRLGRTPLARKKLRELLPQAGTDFGRLLWCSVVATGFNELDLSRRAFKILIDALEQNKAGLSSGVVHALREAGHHEALRRIVFAADPAIYTSVQEVCEVFEIAMEHGAYHTAVRFGDAILRIEPENALRNRIEKLAAGPGFLMA